MLKVTEKIKQRLNTFPQDHKYRETLAKHIKCSPEDLFCVIGPSEFTYVTSKLTFENYSVGNDFKNTQNKIFRANLHIHTMDSDGWFYLDKLLNQITYYADRIRPYPFLVAITNHDILNDCKKALELISKTPENFENVLFVPSAELSSKYIDPLNFSKPVQLELIAYCINPFDPELNKLLDKQRIDNLNYEKDIIDYIASFGADVTFEEAQSFHPLLSLGGSPGFMWALKDYLNHKTQNNPLAQAQVQVILEDNYRKCGDHLLTEFVPPMEKIFEVTKHGILCIAHPKRVNLSNNLHNFNNEQAMTIILDKFRSLGGQAVEIYYQYGAYNPNPKPDSWLEFVDNYCSKYNLIKTGGIDVHSQSIFKCR